MADCISLVNCLLRPVLHGDGQPVFGKQFSRVGVAGRLIHSASLENPRQAVEIIRAEQINLKIVANGGASSPQDIADFFQVGADAVMFGSSPMYLPNLAAEAKRFHPEW